MHVYISNYKNHVVFMAFSNLKQIQRRKYYCHVLSCKWEIFSTTKNPPKKNKYICI